MPYTPPHILCIIVSQTKHYIVVLFYLPTVFYIVQLMQYVSVCRIYKTKSHDQIRNAYYDGICHGYCGASYIS